jgi:hypothetical protein
MSSTPSVFSLGPEQIALMRRRVSVIVGSRDAEQRPHLMRAMGCRLSDDLREVTVFLSASSSRQLLADLRANGLIAVVFAEPSSNLALQLKGRDAAVRPVAPEDHALVQTYVRRFADEIGQLGFAEHVAHTMFTHTPEELVAVHFTPESAFEQTPGPKAGEALPATSA